MSRLALLFVPHAVQQLLEAAQGWRQNRDEAPELLATEFEEAIGLLRWTPG